MGEIFIIVYIIAGYWAAGETVYANKIRIGTAQNLFITRVCVGFGFGWALIPAAIIKKIFIH